jgi:hypothetical protein
MADNVAVTAGAGTTIGADEVTDGTLGTVKVQYVKLMDGTLDGTVKGTIDTNLGLKVDAGAAFTVQVTPTITVPGTAYSVNDVFGGEQTITSAARYSGGGGVLMGITMSFEDDIAAETIEVLIFESNPAGTYTDNGALAVSDADTYALVAAVILDTKTDLGDGALLQARNINIPYVCSGSANLYAVAVIRTAVPTPTATDAAQFTYHLIRD